ncbi:MAG: anti-sigma factor [Caldilineaceae bacterium]
MLGGAPLVSGLGQWTLVMLLALLFLLAWVDGASANGIPVQIFLDHVPVKTTWAAAEGGRGVAVVASNDEQVRVMAQNLPVPPSGSSYYAWLEKDGGGFLPVGALIYQSDGTASLDQPMPGLPYSENFLWVLISLENPQAIGSQPSPDIALAGRLPNAEALPLSGNDAPALLPITGAQSSGPSPTTVLLIALLAAVGLIGTLHLTNAQKRAVRSQVIPSEAATQQKTEKAQ